MKSLVIGSIFVVASTTNAFADDAALVCANAAYTQGTAVSMTEAEVIQLLLASGNWLMSNSRGESSTSRYAPSSV